MEMEFTHGKILPTIMETEVQESFIDYAMSVITSRALPDVRDGLKPVHRRILYSLYKNGMTPDKKHKKSAHIVGDVLAKYHPHGDSSVYDAMVRLAQDFNIRYPLVDGQGNFGSVDGDSAAAMRYTEARMTKLTLEMLADLEKETVDFGLNYDESEKEQKLTVKDNILNILKAAYGMEEEDFLSAELELVPAGKARDLGLDRSMILAYGQDDRVCAFTSLFAMLETENLVKTGCCLLVDKEEIGSVGATGMHSRFFENIVAELIALNEGESELKVRRALANSRMLSSDVSAGYDPMYADAFEKRSAAFLSRGLSFNKFTGSRGKSGSNDANAEYIGKIRKVLDDAGVAYQFAELGKVDVGGGGTIAYIMANYGMEVIDSGVAVLNMHAPYEVSSKADVYEAVKGYKAFLAIK